MTHSKPEWNLIAKAISILDAFSPGESILIWSKHDLYIMSTSQAFFVDAGSVFEVMNL